MSTLRPVAALLSLAALCAGEAAPVPAADVHQPAVQGLTLDQAIELALRRNETPGIALARIAQAEASLVRAAAALKPSVVLGGSISTNDQDRLPHGGSADETTAWSATAEIGLLRASAWSGLAAAKYALRAQQLESIELQRVLAYAVSGIYLNVLAAERQVVAATNRLEVSHASVADAKARLQAGLSTRTDVTRAELEESTAQLSVTRARNYVVSSRLALADLIVASVDGLAGSAPVIDVPSREGDVLSRLALAFRNDLNALQYRESAAEQSVRAAQGRWVPDVSARAAYSQYETNEPVAATRDKTADITLSLVASWTLYDGGDREGAIDQARASSREAGLTKTQQLRGLRKDLLTALADLETAEATVAQAEARDRLALANAEEVRARYKQGLATALEDADAISSRFEAESGLVASRLDLERARLALRQLAGLWPLSDRAPTGQP